MNDANLLLPLLLAKFNPLAAALLWIAGSSSRRAPDLTQRAPMPGPAPAPSPTPPASAPAPVTTPASSPAAYTPAAYSAPEWPQAVPAGLPGFPGSGWELDKPVGPGVSARAMALLPQLWKSGAGTFKTEQTAGRWITYKAVPMGAKKGVVAYRLVAPAATYTPTTTPTTYTPTSSPASSSSSPLGLPTLRRGNKGPSVVALQQRLGIDADGDFGKKTEQAVIAFQRSQGLSPDGVVGKNTWIALTGARDPTGWART